MRPCSIHPHPVADTSRSGNSCTLRCLDTIKSESTYRCCSAPSTGCHDMRPPPEFTSELTHWFHRWHQSGLRQKFVPYLKTRLSGPNLAWLQRGNLRSAFVDAGINPDVHVRSRLKKADVKDNLAHIITELASIVGADGLHDSAMNSRERIPLPASLRCFGSFPLSEQYGEEPVITKQALQRKLVAATGKPWAAILSETGFSNSNRRIASRSFEQTVRLFAGLQRRSSTRWTKEALRHQHHAVFRAAWNLTHRMKTAGVPSALRPHLRRDPVFTLWSVSSALRRVQTIDAAVASFLRKKPVSSDSLPDACV